LIWKSIHSSSEHSNQNIICSKVNQFYIEESLNVNASLNYGSLNYGSLKQKIDLIWKSMHTSSEQSNQNTIPSKVNQFCIEESLNVLVSLTCGSLESGKRLTRRKLIWFENLLKNSRTKTSNEINFVLYWVWMFIRVWLMGVCNRKMIWFENLLKDSRTKLLIKSILDW